MADEMVGFEVLCKATDCVHNDSPGCNIHTIKAPIVLGEQGRCAGFDLIVEEAREGDRA